MNRALTLLLGVIAGFVLVVGGAALVLTLADGDDAAGDREPVATDFPSVDHDPSAARALLDGWSRWRTATFVSSGSWTRVLDARPDEPLTGEVYTAQAPPRRYQIRLGAEVTRIDDADAYERELGVELALVRGYVTGDGRLYDVADTGDGCFHAELVVPALASPWGRWAEYCFDEETGAMTLARVRRQSAVDTETHTAIRSEVTDADFG